MFVSAALDALIAVADEEVFVALETVVAGKPSHRTRGRAIVPASYVLYLRERGFAVDSDS